MPEPVLRVLDYVAVPLLVIVAVAIPTFAIVAIPYAGQKCALARKSQRRQFRVRLRIRQLMTAVLVAAAGLEFASLTRRAYDARQKAEEHAREASNCRWLLGREKNGFWFIKIEDPSLDWAPGLLAYYHSLERYHEGLYLKYDDITRHPWRSFSPDPPEPKMPEWPEMMGPEY
jgi:hypothetical protein